MFQLQCEDVEGDGAQQEEERALGTLPPTGSEVVLVGP